MLTSICGQATKPMAASLSGLDQTSPVGNART